MRQDFLLAIQEILFILYISIYFFIFTEEMSNFENTATEKKKSQLNNLLPLKSI